MLCFLVKYNFMHDGLSLKCNNTRMSACAVGASLRHRPGEALLRQRHQRRGRRGVGVPGLRSGATELPASRLLLRAVPGRVLHRHRDQPVPGVSGQHTPGGAPHLRPGRVRRLRPGEHQQQGIASSGVESILVLIPDFENKSLWIKAYAK